MTNDRWSRASAAARWGELEIFVGAPLGLGLVLVSLWPLVALVRSLAEYRSPAAAVAIYVATAGMVGWLWWRGRSGIGLGSTVVCGLGLTAGNVVLTLLVPADEAVGAALWLHGWGAAIPMVLAFSRPVEEPVAVLALLATTNALAVVRGEQSIAALHDAPLQVGMPVAVTASGLALVAALRHSVANTRRSRQRTDELVQQEHLNAARDRERRDRFAAWDEQAAQLLSDIGNGHRPPHLPDVQARSRELADAIRAELGAGTDSVLSALLPLAPGVEIVVRDLDAGHRLTETDRVALVGLVQDVCRDGVGHLQITVQPAGHPGQPVEEALVVLVGTGLPPPDAGAPGTVIAEPSGRWSYDLVVPCQVARPSR